MIDAVEALASARATARAAGRRAASRRAPGRGRRSTRARSSRSRRPAARPWIASKWPRRQFRRLESTSRVRTSRAAPCIPPRPDASEVTTVTRCPRRCRYLTRFAGRRAPESGLGGVSCASSRIDRPCDKGCQYRAAWPTGPELSVVLVNYNGAGCLPGCAGGARRRHGGAERRVPGRRLRLARRQLGGRRAPLAGGAGAALRGRTSASAPAATAAPRPRRGRLLAFVNFDGQVEPGWDAPLRALLDGDPGISVATGMLLREDGETIEAAGLEIAPNTATYGRLEGAPRGERRRGSGRRRRRLRCADDGAARGVPRARRVLRAALHVRRGGRLLPARPRPRGAPPGRAIRHETGHAAGPARSLPRLYHPARNRLVNAARHLPPLAMARAVATSAAFDLLTLAQVRRMDAARAVARGWSEGLRAIPRERRARRPDERRRAARRLVSLREAVAQQRRLGRV